MQQDNLDTQDLSSIEQPAMLTAADVATLVRCSIRTVYRLADQGSIPKPVRLGRLIRWPREPFERWIADGCPTPAGAKSSARQSSQIH